MEKNNFNKAYIYIIAIFAIGVAISNIISFFNGVGFALMGSSLLLILAIVNILKDEQNKKRFGDLFILITIEFLMLVVLFFAYDFNINGITNNFPLVMRNIYAIYSMVSIGYIVFRYISEIKGKRYNFVEYILGNYVPEKKEKKAKLSKEQIKKNKELENGTLEPKPSSIEVVEDEQVAGSVEHEQLVEEPSTENEEEAENSTSEVAEEQVSNEQASDNQSIRWY